MATERIFADSLGDWKRSCYCSEPRAESVGNELTLFGWVRTRRDHGGVIFVDLRDRSGICQIVRGFQHLWHHRRWGLVLLGTQLLG
jgi:aspartyl-tRNA synthetase